MQLSLQFEEKKKPDDSLAQLCVFLRSRGWTKAAAISNALNISDRKVRAIASRSQGLIVSGPGSKGYKHIANCTGKEIDHICKQLQAQAKLMSDRAGKIRAAWHQQDKRP